MEIKNDYLKIKVDKMGAELKAITNLETGQEVLWNGDATWWDGISPLLFPFIGTSKNKSYTYDGKTYDMKAHGFIAQREFSLDSFNDNTLWFTYTSTEEDYEMYPFKFRIRVGYELSWSKVEVKWLVENLDNKEMIYTIGGHPAFLCEYGDVLTFETKGGKTHFYNLDGSLIKDKEEMEPKRLVMGPEAFPVDTWIYDGIKSATLLNINKGSSVKVTFEDIEYVGIWSPVKNGEMAPYVCIEPWEGLPDYSDASGDLNEKRTVTKLSPNDEKAYSYSIEIA